MQRAASRDALHPPEPQASIPSIIFSSFTRQVPFLRLLCIYNPNCSCCRLSSLFLILLLVTFCHFSL